MDRLFSDLKMNLHTPNLGDLGGKIVIFHILARKNTQISENVNF